MLAWLACLAWQLAGLLVDAAAIKVLLIQNTLLSNDWREGLELSRAQLRTNATHSLELALCAVALDHLDRVKTCIDMAVNETVDAIVVGSSSWNQEIKALAEQSSIPNLHCSGGHPSSGSSYGFAMHVPFTFYSQQPIREAARRRLESAVMLRDYDSEFLRAQAVAATHWLHESSITVVGPTSQWCTRWQNWTKTCSLRDGSCRCGEASEYVALGYSFPTSLPSFYEVSHLESAALEDFLDGIIEDVRSQGADPDFVLNFLEGSSGLEVMTKKQLAYKMYYGGRSIPESSANATAPITLYNVGGGQWHHSLSYSDPIYGSTEAMVNGYVDRFGRLPSYDAAACAAAGVLLMTVGPLAGSSAERREGIRLGLGNSRQETVFGRVIFDERQQNIGGAVNWQVFASGTRVVFHELSTTSFAFPSPSAHARLGCQPGHYGTVTDCLPCQEATFRSTASPPMSTTGCEPCPEGLGTLPGASGMIECVLCPGGRFAEDGLCRECPLGTSRMSNSSQGCLPCEVDHFADSTGLEACKPCPSGSSQPQRGQFNCICDVGYYKDEDDPASWGSTQRCKQCIQFIPGSTTWHPNARSLEDCICPAGSYWHRVDSTSLVAFCKSCGLGLLCKGGKDESGAHRAPLQARGFVAGSPAYEGAEPSYIISCGNNLRCPSDLALGDCPKNALGMACEQCSPRYYDEQGVCRSCTDSPVMAWPIIVLCLCLLVTLGVLYLCATRVDRSHRDAVGIVVMSAFLSFVTMIEMPMFGNIDVELVEPLASLRGISRFLTFDLDTLRLACWLGMGGGSSPLLNYLGTLMAYPLLVILICFALLVGKVALRKDITWNTVIHAQGVLILAIYLVLVAVSARPYRCVGNPDGSSSIGKHRAVLCWTDERHYVMMGFSFVALLSTVLAFLAFLAHKVWQYPRKLRRSGGAKFAKRFSFIFTHFTPRCYYFSLVVTARNFMLGVIPALAVARRSLLVLFFISTIILYFLTQVRLWPWKSSSANISDAGMSLVLILAMVLATMLLDFDLGKELLLIQILSMILVVSAFLGVVAILAHGIYRTYKPMRTYGLFLSHHKLGAGVLARWMKMLMTDVIKNRIFLDSDDVNKLDQILNVCCYDTENVVVLMTTETLKRMWCAAEVASAWKANTNIVFVSCDGNALDEQLIESLDSLWSEEQEATLEAAGVTIAEIAAAYEALRDSPCVDLDRTGANERVHRKVAEEILEQCRGLSARKFSSNKGRMTVSNPGRQSLGGAEIIMLGDTRSPEAGACGRVIQLLLRGQLQEDVIFLDTKQAAEDLNSFSLQLSSAMVVMVLLTQGILQDTAFAGTLAMCPESQRERLVPIRSDEQFMYPDPLFWEDLMDGKIFNGELLEAMGTDVEEVRVVYAKLFNVLALKFTPHGGEHIQATEILLVCGRLQPMLHVRGPSHTGSGRSLRTNLSRTPSKGSSGEAELTRWSVASVNSDGEPVETIKEAV